MKISKEVNMNNMGKLIIWLKVYGLITKEIPFVFTTMNLNDLDSLTYPFQNEKEFFEKNKNTIFEQLKKERKLYNLEFSPIDIELSLNKNCIYILMKERKIRVLFQNIKIKEKEVSLEELTKKELREKLRNIYLLDNEVKKDPNYESIFKGFDTIKIAKIKADLIKEEDIAFFWEFIKNKNRFYSIVRLLFFKGAFEETLFYFLSTIPLKEHREEREYIRIKNVKDYWWINEDD